MNCTLRRDGSCRIEEKAVILMSDGQGKRGKVGKGAVVGCVSSGDMTPNKDPTCEVLCMSCVTWADSYRGSTRLWRWPAKGEQIHVSLAARLEMW